MVSGKEKAIVAEASPEHAIPFLALKSYLA